MSTLPWPEAPRVEDATYPDEYLDLWADRYVERGYFYRGVTLMQFLARPHRYEHSELYPEPLPLLGRQQRIRGRLIEAEHTARPFRHEGEPLESHMGGKAMSKRGDCETCGEEAELIDGMCAVCTRRFGVGPIVLTNDRMLEVLSRHIGSTQGVTISQLVDAMAHPRGIEAADRASTERYARELVVQLRLAGHHVCAHPSRGYYMAATPDELDAACTFLYDRAMTSLQQVAAMKRVSLPDLRGQLHLPT